MPKNRSKNPALIHLKDGLSNEVIPGGGVGAGCLAAEVGGRGAVGKMTAEIAGLVTISFLR